MKSQQERIERLKAWPSLKKRSIEAIIDNETTKKLYSHNGLYTSSETLDGKNVFVIFFPDQPYNSYYNENGGVNVEFQSYCRLVYMQEYNGSISCIYYDYENTKFPYLNQKNPIYFSNKKIAKNINLLLLVERCSSKLNLLNKKDKLLYFLFKMYCNFNIKTFFTMLFEKAKAVKELVF